MAGEKQPPLERVAAFQPPWRERLPNGELGEEYGPSPSTLARRLKEHRLWTWRPATPAARREREAALLAEYLEHGGNATPRELDVYRLLYIAEMSTRAAARSLGISRRTLRDHRKQLLARLETSATYEQQPTQP